jgi:DNA polymerase-3 subunit gamma/tau
LVSILTVGVVFLYQGDKLVVVMSVTLYLKYRPQKVADLHLADVRQMLTKILSSGRIPHAWLFSGPRGVGKTSAARILAKAVNCTAKDRKDFEPCNKCEMCRAITVGSAVDVVEIDAASNRGIDEIRELKERIKLAPMKAKYKVYIIDEVHMLTTEAANALLKTLEEPPANTLFILCTTEAEKLPDTVVSRCTRVTFKRPNMTEAMASLKDVVKGEKISTTDKALELVAAAARGSFRDGTKILEQVLLSSDAVTEESVRQVTGIFEATDPERFVKQLALRQRPECLETLAELEKQGVNLRRFAEMIATELRDQLMRQISGVKSDFGDKEMILKLIEGLDRAYEQMKTAAVSQLPLEIWVIENTGSNVKIQDSESEDSAPQPQVPASKAKVPAGSANAEEEKTEAGAEAVNATECSLEDVEVRWGEVLKAVRPKNHSVEALLRSTKPVSFDGEKLELEVFYKFHKDKLESEKCRQIVETAIAEIFKTTGVKLYLKLGKGGRKAAEEITAEGVGDDLVKAAEEIFKVEAV